MKSTVYVGAMNLCIPADILKQHLVVLGKTGAGKSSVLRHIVEHLLKHKKRVCVIDIKGDWYGLKLSADGKSPGFPVIAFGDFRNPDATDVPINAHSGPDIAELVANGNRPCIIGLRGWMPADITTFWIGTEQNRWKGFASTLFNKVEGELYVVISECHNFAPKGKILDPKAGRVLHWTNRLLSEGRGLGMTFLLDSQRAQKVHNDTLDSCETLVAMRVTHPAARESVRDWINGNGDPERGKEVMNTLAKLARGEAWVWSPEVDFGPKRIQFPMFETYDSFAPAQLQKQVSQSGWADVNLEEVRAKLASVIEEHKANDPAELKRKLAELEGRTESLTAAEEAAEHYRSVAETAQREIEQLRATPKYIAPDLGPVEAKIAHARTHVDGLIQAAFAPLDVLVNALDSVRDGFNQVFADVEASLDRESQSQPIVYSHAKPEITIPESILPPAQRYKPPTAATPAESNGDLSNSCIAVLQEIAEYHPQFVSKKRIAAALGTSAAKSTWRAWMAPIRANNLVEETDSEIRLTPAGVQAIGGVKTRTRTTAEVLAKWRPKLSESAFSILELLVKYRGQPITRDAAASHVGTDPSSSTWRAYAAALRASGLMVDAANNMVAANKEALFL